MIVRFRICNRVRVDAFKKSFAAMSLVAISITICVVYHTPIAQSASRDTLAAYDPSLAKAVSGSNPPSPPSSRDRVPRRPQPPTS